MANSSNTLDYREFQPAEELRPFVQCYWSLQFSNTQETRSHQVLPDGCMDILFDLHSRSAEVVGTMTRSIDVPLEGELALFGVRFKPGAAFHFLKRSASEFTDRSIPTHLFLKSWGAELLDTLINSGSNDQRVSALNDALIENLGESDPDLAFLNFISKIAEPNQNLRKVSDVLSKIGMSERTLERYFRQRVGVTAKTFMRVFRLRDFIHDCFAKGKDKNYADLAAKHGFHDQAHLIHDFKEMTGKTPGDFLLKDPSLSDFYNTDRNPKE